MAANKRTTRESQRGAFVNSERKHSWISCSTAGESLLELSVSVDRGKRINLPSALNEHKTELDALPNETNVNWFFHCQLAVLCHNPHNQSILSHGLFFTHFLANLTTWQAFFSSNFYFFKVILFKCDGLLKKVFSSRFIRWHSLYRIDWPHEI